MFLTHTHLVKDDLEETTVFLLVTQTAGFMRNADSVTPSEHIDIVSIHLSFLGSLLAAAAQPAER